MIPAAIDQQGIAYLPVQTIELQLSEPIEGRNLTVGNPIELRSAGTNALFDDGDDQVIPFTTTYDSVNNTIRLTTSAVLGTGKYRLTLDPSKNASLRDLAGQLLDGDVDGNEGGSLVRTFESWQTNHLPSLWTSNSIRSTRTSRSRTTWELRYQHLSRISSLTSTDQAEGLRSLRYRCVRRMAVFNRRRY